MRVVGKRIWSMATLFGGMGKLVEKVVKADVEIPLPFFDVVLWLGRKAFLIHLHIGSFDRIFGLGFDEVSRRITFINDDAVIFV